MGRTPRLGQGGNNILDASTGERSPLLDRRGGCGIRKWREATLAPQTGWWITFKNVLSILIHHPVRSFKGSFAIFFLMSRPPLLARRGVHSPVDASSILMPAEEGCSRNFSPGFEIS